MNGTRTAYLTGVGNFLFKFRNNILGLNIRVSKFILGHNAECTLCLLGGEPAPRQAETFVHFFFECVYSERYRIMVLARYFPEIAGLGTDEKKNFWFNGLMNVVSDKRNLFISNVVSIFNYSIWELKLQKNLLPVNTFHENLKFSIRKLLKFNKIQDAKRDNNYFICREDLG